VDSRWGPFVDCHDMPHDFTLKFEENVFGTIFSIIFTAILFLRVLELRGTPFKTLPSSAQIPRLVRLVLYCVIVAYDL
jgi:hypothetical protein